jgi:hypothetical protein
MLVSDDVFTERWSGSRSAVCRYRRAQATVPARSTLTTVAAACTSMTRLGTTSSTTWTTAPRDRLGADSIAAPYAGGLSQLARNAIALALRRRVSPKALLTNPRAGLPPQVWVAENVDDALG